MTQVGVKALKQHLGKYLEVASAGQPVVVTRRGRPIAVLSGIEQDPEIGQAWELVAAGLASWQGGKPKGSANPVKVRGKSVADMVIEDRR